MSSILWPLAQLIFGLIILGVGAEWLVRGAVKLAAIIGISPLMIGLTVVAFGTSAPELAVGLISQFQGHSDIAVGAVVGSNIFNILVVLGLTSLMKNILVHSKIVKLEVPLLILSGFLSFVFIRDDKIQQWEGCILTFMLCGYLFFQWQLSRKEKNSEIETEVSELIAEIPKQSGWKAWAYSIGFFSMGLFGLVFGSNWFVAGASEMARFFDVDELVIGLTIVAFGTSLPELATSVVAAFRNQSDMAVGNIIGSNLFNILGVLGITSAVSSAGLAVSEQVISFDFPAMILVSLLCLPIFLTTLRIEKSEGAFFLLLYTCYVLFLISRAKGNSANMISLENFSLYGLIPIGCLIILLGFFTGRRRKASGSG